MNLTLYTKELRYSLKREKCKIDLELSTKLEKAYGFYLNLYKSINEYLANKVFNLTSEQFNKKTFSDVLICFIDVSKEISDFGIKLNAQAQKQQSEKEMLDLKQDTTNANKENNLKRKKKVDKKKYTKPPLSNGKLGSSIRSWAANIIDKLLSENTAFTSLKEDSKIKDIARTLEKEIYKMHGTLPADYETIIDNVHDTLAKLRNFYFISKQIRNKKFELENLKELFEKTSKEMKNWNHLFKKQFHQYSQKKTYDR